MTDTPTEYRDYADMLTNSPKVIQELAKRFPPDTLYRMSNTQQVVTVLSFYEDGTIQVWIHDEYNAPDDWRTGCAVFGVNPDQLVLWTPPLDG